MKLYLNKYSKSGDEYITFEMLNVKKVVENSNLLLIDKGSMSFSPTKSDVNIKNEFYQIFKIQFIISCDIEIAKNILVAFYIDESGRLSEYIMSELPDGYCQSESLNCLMIDYKSYIDICNMTNESVLSLGELIEEKKSGNQGTNTLLKYEGKYYNHDNQNFVFNKLKSLNLN